MEKQFSAVGITTKNGVTKVRFATDRVTRVKSCETHGWKVELFEDLPQPMDKLGALQYLQSLGTLSGDAAYAVTNKMDELTQKAKKGEVKVKATKPAVRATRAAKAAVTA